jgi:hypothetical protein
MAEGSKVPNEMAKQGKLPIEGKAIRFGPGRNDKPLAALWKIWAEGNEVYATSRFPGQTIHISVHETGQVHCRLAAKQKQDFAPLMRLGIGPWFHAFELRFLWSPGALSPTGQLESLKKKLGHLIPTPEGLVLHVNLLIGCSGIPLDSSLPVGLNGPTLWRRPLPDGRIAVLVGRLLSLSNQNREMIRYFHEELKVTVTKPTLTGREYSELHHMSWSAEGGNIIQVVPMGEEALRSAQEVPAGQIHPMPRRFHFRSPRSTTDLIAPNGYKVAVVEMGEVAEQIELTKGIPKIAELGALSMKIEPDNLIAGSPIKALAPRRMVCIPSVGEGSPRSWEYIIDSRFDGSRLAAVVPKQSAALQNKNLVQPVNGLGDDEEIEMVAPAETLELTATLDQPSTSNQLVWRFTLRDRR